jgi:hypothetical protein
VANTTAQPKKRQSKKQLRVRKPGCRLCRHDLESFEKPHLVNVFAKQLPGGDLSGLRRVVVQSPTRLTEVDGHVGYQNDLVYKCKECSACWLLQYWEVDTPETAYEEFGYRYWRTLPLSDAQVALIRVAVKSGKKLPHDQFVQ